MSQTNMLQVARKDYTSAGGRLTQIQAALMDIGWWATVESFKEEAFLKSPGERIFSDVYDIESGREHIELMLETTKLDSETRQWLDEMNRRVTRANINWLPLVHFEDLLDKVVHLTRSALVTFNSERAVAFKYLSDRCVQGQLMCDHIRNTVKDDAKQAEAEVEKLLA